MIKNLAIGVIEDGQVRHLAARVDNYALDLFDLASEGLLPLTNEEREALNQPNINAFLDFGAARHREIYAVLSELYLSDPDLLTSYGVPLSKAQMRPALAPGDFVDFYASRHHAARCAKLTGDDSILPEAWDWMPLAYHGRTAGIIGSGEEAIRPSGWVKSKEGWALRQSRMLDFEMELGFVLRQSTKPGERLAPSDFDDAVFGAVLVADWSARDLQGAEARPLGPFHAKAFATQIGNWIVPIEIMEQYRRPAGNLRPDGRQPIEGETFDLAFEARLRAGGGKQVIAGSANLSDMSWTPAEMMAHLTQSGAPIRSGDLFASGTISGPESEETGCLLERQATGTAPLIVNGEKRYFLADGDRLSISANLFNGTDAVAFDTLEGIITSPRKSVEQEN